MLSGSLGTATAGPRKRGARSVRQRSGRITQFGLYRFYLRLARTPLSPHFLYFYPAHRRTVSAIRKWCGGRVLDVGSGLGPFEPVARELGCVYVSLDHPASSDFATYGAAPTPTGRHLWADAGCLPLKADAFDTAICTWVLEHVPDPVAVLAEIHRSLRAGGYLIGSVPFAQVLHMEPHDFVRISAHGLRNLAQATGFEILRLEPLGRGFHSLGGCANDLILRHLVGINSASVQRMRLPELAARVAVLAILFPVFMTINIMAPLLDILFLREAPLPLGYLFVWRKLEHRGEAAREPSGRPEGAYRGYTRCTVRSEAE